MTRAKILIALVSISFVTSISAVDVVRPDDWQRFMIKYVDPEYPAILYRRGIQGRGIFFLKIDQKTGEVNEVKVLRSTGHTLLNELAAKAFLQWRFRPGVPNEIRVPYEFHVRGVARQVH